MAQLAFILVVLTGLPEDYFAANPAYRSHMIGYARFLVEGCPAGKTEACLKLPADAGGGLGFRTAFLRHELHCEQMKYKGGYQAIRGSVNFEWRTMRLMLWCAD